MCATFSQKGCSFGYEYPAAPERLRQMVPIREQLGVTPIPGLSPNVSDAPDSPGGAFLERAFNDMMTELL